MRVKLFFSVARKGLPAVLTVRDFNGEILFYRVINSKENAVCFNTCGKRNIIVSIRPYSADYYESSQFIKLPCVRCYRLYLSFDFVKRTGDAEVTQVFYLCDAVYRFPIRDATLEFGNLKRV